MTTEQTGNNVKDLDRQCKNLEASDRSASHIVKHIEAAAVPNMDRIQFMLRFKYDVTPKQTGKRITLDEIGLYTVRDGKITKKEFFYGTC